MAVVPITLVVFWVLVKDGGEKAGWKQANSALYAQPKLYDKARQGRERSLVNVGVRVLKGYKLGNYILW